MGHAVHYRDENGEKFEDVDSLDAALRLVEKLRNEREVTDVRVFRQVPIEFRTYFRAAVVDEDEGAPAASPATPTARPTAVANGDAPTPPPAVSDPPPGSMPLVPPAAKASDEPSEEGEPARKTSLFNRG